jgi:hypothetical protein
MAKLHVYVRTQVNGTNEELAALEEQVKVLQAALEKAGATPGSVSLERDGETPAETTEVKTYVS